MYGFWNGLSVSELLGGGGYEGISASGVEGGLCLQRQRKVAALL